MAPGRKQGKAADIPGKAYRKFQHARSSIPIDVIGELFRRAGIPEAAQLAFWQEAEKKEYERFIGIVSRITTRRDGTVEVEIANFDGSEAVNLFNRPDAENPDLTEDQLKELKRAQGDRTIVVIEFQSEEDGSKPVNSVSVMGLLPGVGEGHGKKAPLPIPPSPGGTQDF